MERVHQVHFAFKVEEIEEEEEMKPTTFQEAWWHPNLNMREKWREAIRLEFHQMLKNGVWRKESGQEDIPNGRKGFRTKWVFKIK